MATLIGSGSVASGGDQLQELFAPPAGEVPAEVLAELLAIQRLHGLDPQELFYRWESFCINGGTPADSVLNLDTARALRRTMQEALERDSRARAARKGVEGSRRPGPSVTPRQSSDVFEMLDGLVSATPRQSSSTKRRAAAISTPTTKASKTHVGSSPGDFKTPLRQADTPSALFAGRGNAGDIVETLNGSIAVPPPVAGWPPTEARVKLKANTELAKFSHRTMAMKLSEGSEMLDDRIDEFAGLVQTHYELDDDAFGNPTCQGTNEIVAVGRIATDGTGDGSLVGSSRPRPSSLVLETSRRTGSGRRVPLRLESVASFSLFTGQIVALRGKNASGEFFTVTEVLDMPLLPLSASSLAEVEGINSRLRGPPPATPGQEAAADEHAHENTTHAPRPLTFIVAAGPYTSDIDLSFEPLYELLDQAVAAAADVVILCGPFLDIEHPLVRKGLLTLPPAAAALVDPDTSDLTAVFKALISVPLQQRLAARLPGAVVLLSPSTRDAVSTHLAWPQDRLPKRTLGLPRQCVALTNPVTVSLNDIVLAVSTADVLDELRRAECVAAEGATENPLARLAGHVIRQRHFFPVFPPTDRTVLAKSRTGILGQPATENQHQQHQNGASDADTTPSSQFLPTGTPLDLPYLKLGDWLHVRPDMLLLPSTLTPFAKVVDSVLTINPGTLSKRRGPGTYARLTLLPLQPTEEERTNEEDISHRVFERARVDIIRI